MFQDFDPNGVGLKDATIFGLPFTEENAILILIPAPWAVTVSYRGGAENGPQRVFEESFQIDLYDPDGVDAWKNGYYMLDILQALLEKSKANRKKAESIIMALEEGISLTEDNSLTQLQNEVNIACAEMNDWVYNTAKKYLDKGKKVALIGGDHSTPLGIIKAVAEQNPNIGILHIDAHADLRIAYEGFTYSHASIMYNVLTEISNVGSITQVGIRDYCDEEKEIADTNPKVTTFYDRDIKTAMYEGASWKDIVQKIIDTLPEQIYISFDIDGLDPKLCPNTGTPVPGGFELEQIFYLIRKIKESNKQIISFDVNEVSDGAIENSIDPIVGARAVYKLCNFLIN